MRSVSLLALLTLLILPSVPAAGTSLSLVEGAATGFAASPLCGPVSEPGVIHVTATRDAPGFPWSVRLQAVGAPCPAAAVANCFGFGSAGDAIPLTCDDGSVATFGPVSVCYPGATSPPPAAPGIAEISVSGNLGSFQGSATVLVTGPAVAEAQLLCL